MNGQDRSNASRPNGARPDERPSYRVEPVHRHGALADLRFVLAGPEGRERTWHLWGRAGGEREQALADGVPGDCLPVLLGSGLGVCLERLLDQGRPVAVVDDEPEAQALTNLRQEAEARGALWLDEADPGLAMEALERWRADQGGGSLAPVRIPLYQRLRPGLYKALALRLDAEEAPSFWERARYPKFASALPRVLLLHSDYFLMDEIGAALDRLGAQHHRLEVGDSRRGREGYVEDLLGLVASLRPDFVLTVNHLGLDREGKLAGLLQELGLPLASWFVDSPELILYRYPHQNVPGVAVFSWDADAVAPLNALGFDTVFHLPLATDPDRFHAGAGEPDPSWRADVAFVGHSLVDRVEAMWTRTGLGPGERAALEPAVQGFASAPERSPADYLRRAHAPLARLLDGMESLEAALNLEKYVTFAATREYRARCLRRLEGREPLIVGDPGWSGLLGPDMAGGGWWRWHAPVDYGRDLPRLYPAATVNVNATSLQMKGAVNQRVFDVPACGGFVFTDARRQLEELFEPGREVAVYQDPDELAEGIERYLRDEAARTALVRRARRRVLAEHTYDHRLERLISCMRDSFG